MTPPDIETLKKYIRANYNSQEEFAKAVGLSRQGIAYTLRTAKNNGGRLSKDFLKRLEHYGINIFDWKAPPKDENSTSIDDKLIELLKATVEAQRETIAALKERLQELEFRQGKAGARRHSA